MTTKGMSEKKMLEAVRKAKGFVCFHCNPSPTLPSAEAAIAHQIAAHSVALIQPVAQNLTQVRLLNKAVNRRRR
jgi:hypothetical protein